MKFAEIAAKEEKRKVSKPVTTTTDLEKAEVLVKEIQNQNVDITSEYSDWVNIGLSLSTFGEPGRQLFHDVSSVYSGYDSTATDKKYDDFLKNSNGSVSIASFFHYCKEFGITIPKEKQQKNNQRFLGKVTKFDKALIWITENHNLKRNIITGRIDNDGKILTEEEFNGLFIDLKRDVNITLNDFGVLINSPKIDSYNPLHNFIEENKHRNPKGLISKIVNAIGSDTGLDGDNFSPQYTEIFFKKWLVGLIASIYGDNYNPLMLVLIGPPNTGKTQFWRDLLPQELNDFFCHSRLDAGKDSEELMVTKLLILNDELDGFTKREAKTFRSFISASSYTYRRPYGRRSETRVRLASVAGTSNEMEVINDISNNRRVIPMMVNKQMNYKALNAVEKTELLMEAYHLYNRGFDYALSSEEIDLLQDISKPFSLVSVEEELIMQKFQTPEGDGDLIEKLSSTQILQEIEIHTKQRLFVVNVGRAMNRLGFPRRSGRGKRWFNVVRKA